MPSGKTANLTADQEVRLIREAQAGNQEATTALLEAHDGWLRSLAYAKAKTSRLEMEDLLQEAHLALLDVIRSFDTSRTERLNTAARAYVHGALVSASLAAAPIPVPRMTYFRYLAAMDAAGGDARRAVEHATSGDHPMTEETFWAVYSATAGTRSVEARRDFGSTSTDPRPSHWFSARGLRLADVLPEVSTGDPEAAEVRERASRLLDRLEPKAREVVERAMGFHTGEPQKDADIAAAMGLSRPTVQRMRVRALEMLRSAA